MVNLEYNYIACEGRDSDPGGFPKTLKIKKYSMYFFFVAESARA